MGNIISGVPQQIQSLSDRAKARLNSAYALSTNKAYESKFRIFVAFCCFASVNISEISTHIILAFLEFLNFNKVSHSGMANYLSAVKTRLSNFGFNTGCFHDSRIKVYTKAIMRNAPFKPSIQTIIDVNMLHKLTKHCDNMYMGIIFKAAILTSFFSFLRISNLVPHSISTFDHMKQLARADVIFAPPGAHIIIKWSKTLQFRNKIKVIKIPSLGTSSICPVAALKAMLKLYKGSSNSPLFQIKCFGRWVPLTDTRLRKALAKMITHLGWTSKNLTFHSLRRSGATWAFNSNIPMHQIQSHGTWTSEAVWSYITQDHNATDVVATTFQNRLLS